MLNAARASLRPALARAFAPGLRAFKHTLPPLPYAYNALEPYICEEIMTLHHKGHHQAYVNGLNAAEESYAKADTTAKQISLQNALKFNGGGHINHTLFWKNLAPANAEGGKLPKDGALEKALVRDFGSVEEFKKQFNAATAAIQGSGWGWLGYNTSTGKLEVATTANQDPLLSLVPILGVDIWEHYKNVKADYLKAIWNVINFEEAERRLVEASK